MNNEVKTSLDMVIEVLKANKDLYEPLVESTDVAMAEGISNEIEVADDIVAVWRNFSGNVTLTADETEVAASALLSTELFQSALSGNTKFGPNTGRRLVSQVGTVSHTVPGFTELLNQFAYQDSIGWFTAKYYNDHQVTWDTLAWAIIDSALYGTIKPSVEAIDVDIAASKNIGKKEATSSTELAVVNETTTAADIEKIFRLAVGKFSEGEDFTETMRTILSSTGMVKYLEYLFSEDNDNAPLTYMGVTNAFGSMYSSKIHCRAVYTIAYDLVSRQWGFPKDWKGTDDDMNTMLSNIYIFSRFLGTIMSNDPAVMASAGKTLKKVAVKLNVKKANCGLDNGLLSTFNSEFTGWFNPSRIYIAGDSVDDTNFGVLSSAFNPAGNSIENSLFGIVGAFAKALNPSRKQA